MSDEHTPGPWFAGAPFEIGHGVDSVSVGPFQADEHYEDTICDVFGENHPAVANARLIAAAPDLLAVCRAVAEHFVGTDAPLGIAASDAIAKATAP